MRAANNRPLLRRRNSGRRRERPAGRREGKRIQAVVIKKVKERASYPLFCCERRTSWQFHEI
nr:MAG TPA: hypothetical protein [Caudoviricetes sp.]